jgi:hypothetical protein
MIRFLLRALGLLCLAAAFVFFVYDGTKSIAANALVFIKVDEVWTLVNAASRQQFQTFIVQHTTAWLWDPVALTVLNAPAFVALAILGAVLVLLGRRKKPLIGYDR